MKEKTIEQNKKAYIKQNYNSLDPIQLLRVVRYILRTPEGESIVKHTEKIMARLNKQKADFLAKKNNNIV